MQIRQWLFNCTDMQVLYLFSRQNFVTFDISHAFLPLTMAVTNSQKPSSFIGPPYVNLLRKQYLK